MQTPREDVVTVRRGPPLLLICLNPIFIISVAGELIQAKPFSPLDRRRFSSGEVERKVSVVLAVCHATCLSPQRTSQGLGDQGNLGTWESTGGAYWKRLRISSPAEVCFVYSIFVEWQEDPIRLVQRKDVRDARSSCVCGLVVLTVAVRWRSSNQFDWLIQKISASSRVINPFRPLWNICTSISRGNTVSAASSNDEIYRPAGSVFLVSEGACYLYSAVSCDLGKSGSCLLFSAVDEWLL